MERPDVTSPTEIAEQIRLLQVQVRNLRRVVVVLAIVVVALFAEGGNVQRLFEGFAATTLIFGAFFGVLIIIFGGARFLEKKFPPQQP